jgi:hypothetical protein
MNGAAYNYLASANRMHIDRTRKLVYKAYTFILALPMCSRFMKRLLPHFYARHAHFSLFSNNARILAFCLSLKHAHMTHVVTLVMMPGPTHTKISIKTYQDTAYRMVCREWYISKPTSGKIVASSFGELITRALPTGASSSEGGRSLPSEAFFEGAVAMVSEV